jgi:Gpi18-like mannosyltransferase
MQVDNPPSITKDENNEQTSAANTIETQSGWRAALDPWWKATLAILPIFIATRFLFVLLTYFGVVLFTVQNYSPQILSSHTILFSWYRWDAARFGTIAMEGYKNYYNSAFFPFFPLLEYVVGIILHKGVLVSGMLISNLAFLGTLIVLYRFVETEFDIDTAKRTTLYFAIFPTAFFFFAAYNESLFMFFMLASFYALRQGSWWLAGLFGGLATITRSIGLLLLVIFLYEFVRQLYPQLRQAWNEKDHWRSLRLLSGLPAALPIPLALGIFSYYLYTQFHDPLAFTHSQAHWHLGPTFPWVALWTSIKMLLNIRPFTFAIPHILIDLTAVVLFATLLTMCFVGEERFAVSQWSMLIFGVVALVYPLLFPGIPGSFGLPYDPLPSMDRYVLEIFPAFILLARLGRRSWVHQTYLLFALPMLTFLVLQFLTGHWTV